MAGIMVKVLRPTGGFGTHPALHQVFMDIQEAASGKDAIELILQQLIHAGPAGHDHRADIEIIEGIGNPMKEHQDQ